MLKHILFLFLSLICYLKDALDPFIKDIFKIILKKIKNKLFNNFQFP